ncbi:MAG TPA: efflux RND transporter periplasmic adaptor subunit [Verrucomicrobiae bacterium]|nr:efflux RND transporter periplasmic adaptor subunit [Verrucomicrobiae bacterium]
MDTTQSNTTTQPKLRRDLVLSAQGNGDATALIIKDPATAKFFRFRQVEAFVLQRLDGATSLDALRPEVERTFGVAVAPATLEQFVAKLDRLGLLAKEEETAVSHAPPKRARGSLLYLRLASIDPDRLLTRLDRLLRFCFTPAFVVLSALLILAGVGITASNWTEILQDFRGLWSFQTLLVMWVVVSVAITFHEFAHGLTCKHFGGSVHELGFLLLYFQPAFYCNVSDAWLFPKKSRRLWVGFAGAYCDLLVWALAAFAWRITDFSAGLHRIALIILGTSVIRTLFNLNPLIKLDGYYLLSDYLEIPNLRAKAMAYLKRQLTDVTPRERRIYIVYGLLAATYSYWLLAWVALWVEGSLTRQYQGSGFIMFSALLGLVFQRPLGTGYAKLTGAMKSGPATLGAFRRLAKFLAVLVPLGALLFFVHMELKVAGEFNVLPAHNADIRPEVEGIISEILVDEGDVVRKGDLIARLSSREYSSDLRQINAAIDQKQANLKMLKAGSRAEELDLARTTVEKGRERVKYARDLYNLNKQLFDQSLLSRKELAESEEEVSVRQKELEESQGKLKVLLAGSRPEEIEATEAEIARLESQRRYDNEQIQRIDLVSPIDGVVTTHKLKEKLGQHVLKGDLIAKVHELKTVTAEIAVSEKEIADVAVGQKVLLKARAYPQRLFEGTVTSVAPTVNKLEKEGVGSEKTILVTTQLDNAALLLKPEMTGTAKICCGDRRLLDLVTRRLSRYLRVEFWSWW